LSKYQYPKGNLLKSESPINNLGQESAAAIQAKHLGSIKAEWHIHKKEKISLPTSQIGFSNDPKNINANSAIERM